MLTFDEIDENFKFLLMESRRQVSRTCRFLGSFEESLFNAIVSRDDYIDNLKTTIENNCFISLNRLGADRIDEIKRIRAIHVITINLERIADFTVNIANQVRYLYNRQLWHSFDYGLMCKIIIEAMKKIPADFRKIDISNALAICKSEDRIDKIFKSFFDRTLDEMRAGRDVETYVTIIFIFRYLERIGDSILNIGEALLFVIMGEKIKIKQFDALKQSLENTGINVFSKKMDFKSFWGTRSGCNISKVAVSESVNHSKDKREVIFKAGNPKKIRREKENLEKWNRIMPGLVPRIITYEDKGAGSSMLIEFLHGSTLDELILNSFIQTIYAAIGSVCTTLDYIWSSTMIREAFKTDFMNQLLDRIDPVRRTHPGYFRPCKKIGSLKIYSTDELIKKCQDVEILIPAPFRVFIHGDFNANNVLISSDGSVHLIDVYRSKMSDYVQDISVGLISLFRMPVFQAELREKLNHGIKILYRFASEFAQRRNDTTFDARIALALARSFMTSTRFELNPVFAGEMFFRSTFLMEKMVTYSEQAGFWTDFKLPEAILYYEGSNQ